jgi:hypothetical protein
VVDLDGRYYGLLAQLHAHFPNGAPSLVNCDLFRVEGNIYFEANAGTSGVQFVGYTLAVLAILGNAKVAVALLVLGVPIIDTFWIIVRRVTQGRSPFSPDRSHIHHRLLDLGLSHRDTVLVIYGICAGLALIAMVLSEVSQLYAFLGIFVVSGLILFGPTRGAFRRPEELEADAYDGDDAGAAPGG